MPIEPELILTAPVISHRNPRLRSLLAAYPGSRYGNQETRGLDSEFALTTYVETDLDTVLLEDIHAGRVHLVILFGNAGDGKTAFLQQLGRRLGLAAIHSSQRIWAHPLANGQQLTVNLDGSAAWQGRSADELLDELFAPFSHADYRRDRIHIVAINSGKLLEWLERQPPENYLTQQLQQILRGEQATLDPHFRLIDLNRRSLVGGVKHGDPELTTHFLTALLDRLVQSGAIDSWLHCPSCRAADRCTAWQSVQALRRTDTPLRERLTLALQACHQRGEIHITARELRAALSYLFFGLEDCDRLHRSPDYRPEPYWQRAFNAESPHRQGELLAELARFDPALESDAVFDRELLRGLPLPHSAHQLAERRRWAWFHAPAVGGEVPITLANGRYLQRFRQFHALSASEQQQLLRDLCWGIAHLEALPAVALQPTDYGLPLRITPRTPIDTVLWVAIPWSRFTLEAPLPAAAAGLEVLHTHLHLLYHYGDGRQEVLRLGLELFTLLLELKEGLQLNSVAQAGIFAHLEIFTQRLAFEANRELYGWHPVAAEQIFRLRVVEQAGQQQLIKEPL